MSTELKERVKSFKQIKGSKGSICVIGGSFEYSGAPYFSAISALRTGTDLSFVICEKHAANVIKTYSPELIVFGLFDQEKEKLSIELPLQIRKRVSVIVVGPGLSRNVNILEQVKILLLSLRIPEIPIVFDGDGIYLFCKNSSLFEASFKRIILTPNINEFKLLQPISVVDLKHIIYVKGEVDKIMSRNGIVELHVEGAPRRCGGIGDVLSGVIAAILSMCGNTDSMCFEEEIECIMLGGRVVRKATKLAFEYKKRSMSAIDVIEALGKSFEQIFE